ncbi:hypothetical protein M5K25_001477 [Dendrobium thyrsiflorum]|uniref:C3H1-type domain-containing protein n=1 Tax=Dendrobium thyrsiflorum TaxID=117978 RepID=A0ABD0VQK0_DENTH
MAAMELEMEMEEKLATVGGERGETTPPSNASSPVPGDDNRSCGMNLPEKLRSEEDGDEKEENSPSSGGLRKRGVDLHSHWKTSLCSFFRRPPGGVCRHGDACRYAHGEAELRPRPNNSWDPTSERAKKLLKTNDGDAISSLTGEDEDAAVDLSGLDKCLIGLPKKWASENLKSFLDSQGISHKTAKKKKGMTVGFVSFADADQIICAIEVLKVNPFNGKQVKVADAVCRSQKKKQTMEITKCGSITEDGSLLASGDDPAFGTSNVQGIPARTKAVCDVVTPLAQMPYNDQLEHKRNSLLQTLKRLTRNARKACPDGVPLPEWVLKSREIGGLPCKLEGILESPLVNGYRNKCEFSVGYSLEGKLTVGFMLGNFREGVTAVEEPGSCPNVSIISCKYAMLFQDFLQSSVLPVWNRIDNIGFWRQFTVREGRCPSQVALDGTLPNEIAEVMLIVQVCSLDHEEEQIRSEFNRMTDAFVNGAAACSPPLPLTAIVVQDHRGISNAAPANCPLLTLQLPKEDGVCVSGTTATTEARIHDHISNLRFSISPTAFFQVNTLAAEKLYSLAGDWADLSPDTILFDICCGTGTIGLTLAHRVGMVVGIEMNESAVSDANRNAEINGIKNCRFICGKAEDVMGSILKEYLDAPQQPDVVSRNPGSNGAVIGIGNETNKIICEEDLQDDTVGAANVSAAKLRRAAINVSAANRSAEVMLPCSEDGSMDKLADSTERNNVDGSSEQLLTDDSSTVITADICTTQLDEGSREASYIGRCSSKISNDSVKFTQNLENLLPGESTANDAAVFQFKRVVAIVDPPRVGLHPTVIKALRTHPRIRRLVYISCNPETLVANAIELCTPTTDKLEKGKGNRGWRNMSNAGLARYRVKSMPTSEAFEPVRAMGVDLFPHTPHCEMVMLLER